MDWNAPTGMDRSGNWQAQPDGTHASAKPTRRLTATSGIGVGKALALFGLAHL